MFIISLLLLASICTSATPMPHDSHSRILTHANSPRTTNSTGMPPSERAAASSEFAIPFPNLPTDWMHQNLPLLGCQPLRRLCLPGSHDSGMSTWIGGTFLSTPQNTLTQWTDVASQLAAGFRYFDLRPVIAGGRFVIGHYSKVGKDWFGGNGQDLASIITQVNAFLAANEELVILDLSHMLNSDAKWRTLNSDEFGRLLGQLEGLEYRYAGLIGPNGDLSTLPLNDFIGNGPCVLVITSDSSVTLPSTPPAGIYPYSALNIYNSYANTPFSLIMEMDQLDKMSRQRTSLDSSMFLLSWTLTTALDIRQLAEQAHEILVDDSSEGLWQTINTNKASYPNIIMIDGIGMNGGVLDSGKKVAGLSMAVNSLVLEGVSCPA